MHREIKKHNSRQMQGEELKSGNQYEKSREEGEGSRIMVLKELGGGM